MQNYLDRFNIEYTHQKIIANGGQSLEKFMKRPRVAKIFEEVLTLLPSLIFPKVTYRSFKLNKMRDNSLLISDDSGKEFEIGTGLVFRKCMKEATDVILGIGTLGSKIDEQIVQFNGTNQMGSVILDLLGSWTIRDIQKQATVKIIEEIREQGWFNSIVLIPGDNEWDIHDHEKFFNLIDTSVLKVKLKSITVM